MDCPVMRLAVILFLIVVAAQCVMATDIYVEIGTAVSNVNLAAAISKTSAPPVTIWIKPGTYPAFSTYNQHTGTIRSLSGELVGYGSAQDTIIDSAGGGSGANTEANTTVMGLSFVRSATGAAIGNSDGGVRYVVRCRFESNTLAATWGTVGSPNTIFSNCYVTKNSGLEMFYNCDLYGSVIVGNHSRDSYPGTYAIDSGPRYCVGNTFFANSVTANGEIYIYSGALFAMNNLIVTTNRAFAGSYTSWGGNVSQSVANASAIFYSSGTGVSTNLVPGIYRLVPNSVAWSSGVFTSAAVQARTDMDGIGWRGITNNCSGAYWQNPSVIQQYQGVFIP